MLPQIQGSWVVSKGLYHSWYIKHHTYHTHICISSLSPLSTGQWETDEDMPTQAPRPYTLYNRWPGTHSVMQEKLVYISFYSLS